MTTITKNPQSEITERVHKICQLLSEGLSVGEISAMVEFGHHDFKARKSFIIAVKAGKIHKNISENYDFKGYKTELVEKDVTEKFWVKRDAIIQLVRLNKSSEQITKELYNEEMPFTFEQLVMFVKATRKTYIQNQKTSKMSKKDYERKYGRYL